MLEKKKRVIEMQNKKAKHLNKIHRKLNIAKHRFSKLEDKTCGTPLECSIVTEI